MELLFTAVSMQRRVQYAALLQFAKHGAADPATTAAICPGTDARDLEAALAYLLEEGSIDGPTWRLESFVVLAQGGWLRLTPVGQQRLDEDAA